MVKITNSSGAELNFANPEKTGEYVTLKQGVNEFSDLPVELLKHFRVLADGNTAFKVEAGDAPPARDISQPDPNVNAPIDSQVSRADILKPAAPSVRPPAKS